MAAASIETSSAASFICLLYFSYAYDSKKLVSSVSVMYGSRTRLLAGSFWSCFHATPKSSTVAVGWSCLKSRPNRYLGFDTFKLVELVFWITLASDRRGCVVRTSMRAWEKQVERENFCFLQRRLGQGQVNLGGSIVADRIEPRNNRILSSAASVQGFPKI